MARGGNRKKRRMKGGTRAVGGKRRVSKTRIFPTGGRVL